MDEEKKWTAGPKKLTKTEKMLRIVFVILVITSILLLGAWLAKLIGIAFNLR